MSLAQTVAEALRAELGGAVRRTKRGLLVRCPAHEDRGESLSLAIGRNGTLLHHCFAGCSPDAVRTALRNRGLLPESRPCGAEKGTKKPPLVSMPQINRARTVLTISDAMRAAGEVLSDRDLEMVKAAKRVLALAKRFPLAQPSRAIPWMIRLAGGEVRIDVGANLRGLPGARYEPVVIHWPQEVGSALIVDQDAPEAVLHAMARQCLRAGARVVRVVRGGEIDVYRQEVRHAAA